MNEMEMDQIIKKITEDTFNVNRLNTENNNVLAAMIAASAGISLAGDITNEQTVIDVLISIYNQENNEKLAELIKMMGPQNVKDSIGFSIDYRDYNQARYFYEINKETLDKYYNLINERNLNYSNESHNL